MKASTDPITLPNVESRTLENGLSVLAVRDQKLPLVTVLFMLKSGAETDEEGRAGQADLSLEMLTLGTEKRSSHQIALDVDYTFLNGAYQQATAANVAAKTCGIITAATTNTVNAASATLSKALLDQLLRTMAANGAEFVNTVIFVNAFQKQKISDIYGYAPQDRNVGGYNIKQIETDFAVLGIVWAPNVPAATLLIADLAFCSPVFSAACAPSLFAGVGSWWSISGANAGACAVWSCWMSAMVSSIGRRIPLRKSLGCTGPWGPWGMSACGGRCCPPRMTPYFCAMCG